MVVRLNFIFWTIFATGVDKSFLVKLEDGNYSKTEIVASELVEFVEEPPYSRSEDQLFKFQGKYGVVNYENKIVIPAVYDLIENIYVSKEFIVKKNNKYGVVNSENQIVVKIEYDDFWKSKETILFTRDRKKVKKNHTIRFR